MTTDENREPHECKACQGTGRQHVVNSRTGRTVPCSRCMGSGVVWIRTWKPGTKEAPDAR